MPSPKKVSDLKSTLMNVAQASHYEVLFGGFPYKLKDSLSYRGVDSDFISRAAGLLCYDASLPGSTLATTTVEGNFTGVQQQYAHTRLFNNITLGFYCDSDYKVLKFFEYWIEYISGAGTADTRSRGYFYRMRYPDQYKCEGMRIAKFDRDYKKGVQYNFISLFPVSVSSTPVSYENPNSILRISVDFNFDRYIMGGTKDDYSVRYASPLQIGSVRSVLNAGDFITGTNASQNTGTTESNASLSQYFTSASPSETLSQNIFNQNQVDNFVSGKGLSWDPTIGNSSDTLNFVSRS